MKNWGVSQPLPDDDLRVHPNSQSSQFTFPMSIKTTFTSAISFHQHIDIKLVSLVFPSLLMGRRKPECYIKPYSIQLNWDDQIKANVPSLILSLLTQESIPLCKMKSGSNSIDSGHR